MIDEYLATKLVKQAWLTLNSFQSYYLASSVIHRYDWQHTSSVYICRFFFFCGDIFWCVHNAKLSGCTRGTHGLRSSGNVSAGRPPGPRSSPQSHCPRRVLAGCVCSSACAYDPGLAPIPVWSEEGVWGRAAGAGLEGRRLQMGAACGVVSNKGTVERWERRRSESPSCCFWPRWNTPLEKHVYSSSL